MSLLQQILDLTDFQSPLLRTFVPAFGAACGIQVVSAIPSIIAGSDTFFDVSASWAFVSAIFMSIYLPYLRMLSQVPEGGKLASLVLVDPFVGDGAANLALNWRQTTLSAEAFIWTCRLGYYLFKRTLTTGGDSRFDELKTSPPRFLLAWVGQGAWINMALLPVLTVNSIPPSAFDALPKSMTTDYLGIALYLFGLSFEVVADIQKAHWRAEKRKKVHDEQFMARGLWAMCQYPNYFGEITLWTGIATMAAGILVTQPLQASLGWSGTFPMQAAAAGLAYASPAFISFLLLKVSGVPLSENKYDKKYGNRKGYRDWKRNTPKLFPKIF